ncbi:MAG: ABC transporter permease [Planctomycetota bacterium]
MSRVLQVAWREFASTALTKGFIIGALVVPALLVPIIALIGFLISTAEPPAERGVVAVIDQSGAVTDVFAERINPEAIAERRGDQAEEFVEAANKATSGALGNAGEQAAKAAIGSVPQLQVIAVDPGDDLEAAIADQQELLKGDAPREDVDRLIALAVIDPDAVVEDADRADDAPRFGGYQLFVRTKLDDRTTNELRSSLSWSIREQRFKAAGVDRTEIAELERVASGRTQEVTEEGTRDVAFGLNQILPFAIMFLLFMGVMTGGQYLLTTTVEEKSSRVIEVLLSAVSPMQLMFGKILGQMIVGLALLITYNSLGIIALIVFERLDIIKADVLIYMMIFFLLAYITFAAFMAAIGAAVNELREAQSLMTPIILLLIVSFYLSMPVSQDPDATYAVVLSFIPPVSPFIMLTRIASTEPPPLWQAWLAIGINAIAAYASVWLAAKVFRIGLLMFGKPPSFGTLIKWVRMA